MPRSARLHLQCQVSKMCHSKRLDTVKPCPFTSRHMGETTEPKPGRVLKVGPDKVTVTEKEVIIEAKHPMTEWQVRDLNPIPIYFEDGKYFLVEVRKAAPPFAVRYLLHPWPEGNSSSAKQFYTYDAESVAERDSNRRSDNLDGIVRGCLLPFYPFLGMLWSGVQQRLIRYGFVPHLIS